MGNIYIPEICKVGFQHRGRTGCLMIFDDEAYVELQELCRKTPRGLREAAYDYLPETMEQLKRWTRSDLIPFLFVGWLERREKKSK